MIFNFPFGLGSLDRVVTCKNCGTEQHGHAIAENGLFCQRCAQVMCCYCGCTPQTACPQFGEGCAWFKDEPGCCTACAPEIIEDIYLAETGRIELVEKKYGVTSSMIETFTDLPRDLKTFLSQGEL